MSNIEFDLNLKQSSFRKISIATWRHPVDPTAHVQINLDAAKIASYLEQFKGEDVHVVHFFSKVLAHCLKTYPHLNNVLIRNKNRSRQHINLFYQTFVKSQSGMDLTGFMIGDVDQLSLPEVARLHRAGVTNLKSQQDTEIRVVQKLVRKIPGALLRPAIRFADFLFYTLNLDLSRWGLPRDRFGSAMISYIGAFGYDESYAPLFPFSRCGCSITMGRIKDCPVAEHGQVVVKPMLRISMSLDHRYNDGADLALAFRLMRRMFKAPESFNDIFVGN